MLCARGELELFPLLWQEPVKHRATGQLSVLSVPCVQRVHFCFLCGLEQGISVSVVRFSWLLFVTFSLASILELGNWMLHVLSRR